MSGQALTVSELAELAGVTIQTASGHLSELDGGGLLRPRKQGRHAYYALASDDVARVLEGLIGLAAGSGHLCRRPGPRDAELRRARVCYNHLAGDMGTRMFDSLMAQGHLATDDDDLTLTTAGRDWAATLQIDVAALSAGRTPLCRECLDWIARRSHLAGSLGRALLGRFEALGWASRNDTSRVVRFSPAGQAAFAGLFGPA